MVVVNSGWRRVALWAANLVLYLVLADAAVETLLGGSPVRWFVLGAVIVYGALTALLWKRVGPGPKAVASLLLLEVLVAFSGLKLGALDLPGGITIVKLPTSFIADLLILLTVLVVAVLYVGKRGMPLWARIGVAVVGLYALSPLIAALKPGAGLSAALAGIALPPAHPFWLRGAYLAVEGLLPVAFLGTAAVTVLAAVRRNKTAAGALLLIALLALCGVQIGAFEAGAQGLPTIVAFEHPHAMALAGGLIPSNCNTPLPGIENVAPGAGEAQNLGAGSGAAGGFSELGGGEQTPAPTAAPCVAEPKAVALAPTAVSPAPQLPQPPGPATSQVAITVDELGKILKAYKELPQSVDRSPFDAKAKAAKLGADSAAIFAFVRDQIANEVYPGVLRGADGTLSAQAGNDLDKSLLLGTLLSEQQRHVRYAKCTLPENAARQRISAMFAGPAPQELPDQSQAFKDALIREGISEQRSAELVKAGKSASDALDQAAVQTAKADLGLVRDSLSQSGLKATPQDNSAALLGEAKAHYWVQVQTEDSSRWQDFDPAFPAAKPNQTFCTPSQTYSELPAEAYQYVTFRVKNEYVEGGKLSSIVSFEHQFRAVQLYAQAILFWDLPDLSQISQSGDIAGASNFTPFLVVGDSVYPGREFALASKSGDPGKHFASQWLELEFVAPGRKSVAERPIIDTVDPEQRAKGTPSATGDLHFVALQLMQPHAIAVSTGRLDPIQVAEALGSHLDVDALARLAVNDASQNSSDETLEAIGPAENAAIVRLALKLAGASDRALVGPWKTDYPRARIFRDQPLVVIVTEGLRASADGKPLLVGPSVDLGNNVVRVVPETSTWAEQAFWLNVQAGLVDGALERDLVAYLPVGQVGSAPLPRSTGSLATSSIFALAQIQGLGHAASSGRNAVHILERQFASTGGYRLAAEVGDNTAVVMPSEAVSFDRERRLGVWTVDLQTGHTVALLDTGLRQGELLAFQGMTGYTLEQRQALTTQLYVRCLAMQLAMCNKFLSLFVKRSGYILLGGGLPATELSRRTIWPALADILTGGW